MTNTTTNFLVMDNDAMHGVFAAATADEAIAMCAAVLNERDYFDADFRDAGPLVATDLNDLDEEDRDAVADEFGEEFAA